MRKELVVRISFEEFWNWVGDHLPKEYSLMPFIVGVPRLNPENDTLEVDVALSDEEFPSEWKNKPKALLQLEALKKPSSEQLEIPFDN